MIVYKYYYMDKATGDQIPRNTEPPITTKAEEVIRNDITTVENKNLQAPQFVKKKWTLLKFKRMILKGNFTSARLTAKILGVDKRTIEQWLHLPVIQSALASEINNFTSKIGKSKDWKAQAYLLDKIIDDDKDREESKQDLKQLIVINT